MIYVRCLKCSYNNVAKGIRLLDKRTIFVYTGKQFMQELVKDISTQPLAFPTSIFAIFMIYFFSLHTISSFLKSSLLYCYHFMFEILNAMYVVQYIYVLGDR